MRSDARQPRPTITVIGASQWRVRAGLLKEAALAALDEAGRVVRGQVTIVLTGDKQIRKLNRRYRGKDRATDVLSFEISDGKDAAEPLGDIIISTQTARRQAREYGAAPAEEFVRLTVHGALHLCGYDHHRPREARRMFALSRRIVAKVIGHG